MSESFSNKNNGFESPHHLNQSNELGSNWVITDNIRLPEAINIESNTPVEEIGFSGSDLSKALRNSFDLRDLLPK